MAFDDIQIRPGETIGWHVGDIVGITGPNGFGKEPKGRLVIAAVVKGKFSGLQMISAVDQTGQKFTGGSGCFYLKCPHNKTHLYDEHDPL